VLLKKKKKSSEHHFENVLNKVSSGFQFQSTKATYKDMKVLGGTFEAKEASPLERRLYSRLQHTVAVKAIVSSSLDLEKKNL
jgi:hypothetical protein